MIFGATTVDWTFSKTQLQEPEFRILRGRKNLNSRITALDFVSRLQPVQGPSCKSSTGDGPVEEEFWLGCFAGFFGGVLGLSVGVCVFRFTLFKIKNGPS